MRPDLSAPITGEVLNEMVYTRQVVKEVLRFRPPAPMVPQVRPTPSPSCHGPTESCDSKLEQEFWVSAVMLVAGVWVHERLL